VRSALGLVELVEPMTASDRALLGLAAIALLLAIGRRQAWSP
jgi:hypothetical protein